MVCFVRRGENSENLIEDVLSMDGDEIRICPKLKHYCLVQYYLENELSRSSDKALGYGLDCPGSIPGDGRY